MDTDETRSESRRARAIRVSAQTWSAVRDLQQQMAKRHGFMPTLGETIAMAIIPATQAE